MFISVLARRLKPGKTYEDFIAAWYPDKGFGVSGRGPILAAKRRRRPRDSGHRIHTTCPTARA